MSIHEHLLPHVRRELEEEGSGMGEGAGVGEGSALGGSAVRLCNLCTILVCCNYFCRRRLAGGEDAEAL